MSTMTPRALTGKVPPERVVMLELPRLNAGTMAGFHALVDLAGTVSDAMDTLGLVGAVPASSLYPMLVGKRAVGQAVTMRNHAAHPQIRTKRTVGGH